MAIFVGGAKLSIVDMLSHVKKYLYAKNRVKIRLSSQMIYIIVFWSLAAIFVGGTKINNAVQLYHIKKHLAAPNRVEICISNEKIDQNVKIGGHFDYWQPYLWAGKPRVVDVLSHREVPICQTVSKSTLTVS